MYAKPPPWPPSVNAGRTTAGSATRSSSSSECTIVDTGTCRPTDCTAVAEELAVLGAVDRVDAGADQLDAELGEDARVLRAAWRG